MVGFKIENARKIKKISQKDLAEKIGMTVHGLRNAISNDDFKLSTLQKIADVLEYPISYFISDDVEMIYSGNQIAYGENSNIVQGKGNVIHGAIQGNKVHKVTKDAEASPEIRNMLSELELENKYLKQKVKDLEILIAQKEMLIEEKERMIQLLMGARGK